MFKLLIADDEVLEREALRFIISRNCPGIATIEEASSGREAIAKYNSFKPDIIIMDIKMPGINGIEASKTILSMDANCRIILLTAFNYFDYAKDAIKIGVRDFLVKPAQDEEILSVLNNVMEAVRSERINKTKQSEMTNKLEQVTKYLENELVSSFIVGDTDENQIEEYFDVMNIKFKVGFCLVLNINYVSYFAEVTSQLQRDMIRKRCIEKIKQEFIRLNVTCLVSNIKNEIYIIVLSEPGIEGPSQKEWSCFLTQKVYHYLRENITIDMAIGIGNCFDSPKDISNSFLQARGACDYGRAASGIMHFCDIEHHLDAPEYHYGKEKELCKSIIMCDWSSVSASADAIISWIATSFASLDDVKLKAYELLVVTDKYLEWEANIAGSDTISCFKNLQKAGSVAEIKMILRNTLRSSMEKLANTRRDKHQVLVDKACEHLRKNYMKDITLDEIAGMTGLSSFYFSKVFKLYKKKNFVEYLTHVRTEKAKELLKNPAINIKDICEMVGYNDSNYFTRVFKRTEGITPTEYRSKNML